MKAILNTGRTVPQGEAVEHKASPTYRAVVSVCYMNPVDLMELGITEGAHVAVTSRTGRIVLTTWTSEGVSRGEIFVPLGPYANHIIAPETHATGMPDFKGETVDIVPTDEPVKDVGSLMEEIGGLRYDH
ncbi:MAG: Molybdenum-containing formylmethanofuran dehydrogenase 1 subunit C [Methanoregula sp. PtaU1.Bin051]|nr:MAG: Molybdenum-containing formylmethanofuran dehydrogenase 1 subunit C [Methanoregula sp. PtaU1.Bin051]